MFRRLALALVGVAALSAAVPAAAQVNARQDRQHARIAQGVRSGELTPREARNLHRQQGRIARTEQRMRWRNGGGLSPSQRRHLMARQDAANRNIYRAKHNGRSW